MSSHEDRMRVPVKLNDYTWPVFLRKFIGNNLRQDPRILIPGFRKKTPDPLAVTQAISCFKFGTTFKTTQNNRHVLSDQLIQEHCQKDTVILDVGASDGITSFNLTQKLGDRFTQYFVTDYNLYTYAKLVGKTAFFYDQAGHCILIANNRFLYYPQESDRLQVRFAAHLEMELSELQQVQLIHPKLAAAAAEDDRIQIRQFSVFDQWAETQPNLIKVANVLNPQYFSSEQIKNALRNLHQTLPEDGLLLIIENRREEQSALYQKQGEGFVELQQVGPQIDIYQEVASISAIR